MEKNYVKDKVIIVTGATGAFGVEMAKQLAQMGGQMVLAARNKEKLESIAGAIKADGGEASYIVTDVSKRDDMFSMAKFARSTYGRVDVLINNAGIMPLAFFSDHEKAWEQWDQCIDINFKGTLYGIEAVYDTMMEQGAGQIINVSSIWGNAPAVGGAVYLSTKVAIRYLTESLSKETRGKIKTTVVRPTGVTTGLMSTVINPEASVGILQDKWAEFKERNVVKKAGTVPAENLDVNSIKLWGLTPQMLAESIVHVVDQPWGVNISDITVRSSNDLFML